MNRFRDNPMWRGWLVVVLCSALFGLLPGEVPYLNRAGMYAGALICAWAVRATLDGLWPAAEDLD